MKTLKIIYNSFLLSLTIATLCFSNTWLQMRANTGYIFFALLIVLVGIFYWIDKKKSCIPNAKFTIINIIVCTIIGLVVYGWRRMQVVSASLIREGIHQRSLSFSVINRTLLVIVVIGFGFILWSDYKKHKNLIKD